ncbi:MAG: redoxin domain-containing protein [Gammaproteobacteria bacterium]|nr:redoxin domain-containing protein [Gammaproteobacteria bacterium]
MDIKSIRWKRHFITLAIFLVIYLGIRAYQLRDYSEGTAPLFSAVSVEDQVINLRDYRGEPVLIYFWADWCPVCKFERGAIEGLSEDYPVITVASWSESFTGVRQYFSTEAARKATIYDPQGELAGRYGISGVPSFFILDADGQIRFIERGYTSSLGLRLRLILAKHL